MQELNGFDIPTWSPTADGTCLGDPAAAVEASERGWWTCGWTTRDTDIVACPKPMDWGVSFDDGPSNWSECWHLFPYACVLIPLIAQSVFYFSSVPTRRFLALGLRAFTMQDTPQLPRRTKYQGDVLRGWLPRR